MGNRTATYPNYQERATEFSIGDKVHLLGESSAYAGRVVAVYPAIGMVDVEYPHGNTRLPVEDLQILEHSAPIDPPEVENNTVDASARTPLHQMAERVAKAFVKHSIYWGARNRKYRAKQSEIASGIYLCPKCVDVPLKKAIYKREEDDDGFGKSVRLMGCPRCMFLIKECDIIGHPSNLEVSGLECDEEILG